MGLAVIVESIAVCLCFGQVASRAEIPLNLSASAVFKSRLIVGTNHAFALGPVLLFDRP